MKRNIIALLMIVGFLASCNQTTTKTDESNQETQIIEAAIIPDLTVGDFVKKAGDYVDQEIKVTGIVDHLCKHGGKKLFMVSDDGDLHIESDQRFDDSLAGMEITVKGIVREFRVDEGYCLKMEEDNIQSHKNGETDEDLYTQKMKQIQFYRDSMEVAKTDHLSFYSVEFVDIDKKN